MCKAGWELKEGKIVINKSLEYKDFIKDFMSKKNIMKNLYKLLIFKAIINLKNLGNLNYFNEIAYEFAKEYFDIKHKYKLNMCIYNGKSKKSTADTIIDSFVSKGIKFENLNLMEKNMIVSAFKELMKKNVIGAVYKSFKGSLYSFNIKKEELYLNTSFKRYLDNNREVLYEIINYRMIEFFKISEKNKQILESELKKYQEYYINTSLYEIISFKIGQI